MTELTSRERVLMTLEHKVPDRVPIDVGGGLTETNPDLDGPEFGVPPLSPVGFSDGSEWEIRTYVQINIGK